MLPNRPIRIVAIVGTGNVAWHIGHALIQAEIKVNLILGRDAQKATALATNIKATAMALPAVIPEETDLVFICVSDAAIGQVAGKLNNKKALVVHTAGSVPMAELKEKATRYGVIYPLQTFNRNRKTDFSRVPLFVEASSPTDLHRLTELAGKLSSHVTALSSEKRMALHLAAVFSCNFSNHMYSLAATIMATHGLPFDYLVLLIEETAQKIKELPPDKAQTGPAVRGDMVTVEKHTKALAKLKPIADIYTILSTSIRHFQMNYNERFMTIKAFVFDVDGVCTDGSVFLSPDGEFARTMNIKDGYAIQYCVKQGFPVAIITGGNSDTVKKRFNYLGVTDIYMKSCDKMADYEDFRLKYQFAHEEVLYMGDDIPDLEVMHRVGVAACPADAAEEVKAISLFISDRKGGDGCVRQVIEQVLKAQGKWLAEGAFVW